MFELILPALLETLMMVFIATFFALFIGVPLGVWQWMHSPLGLRSNKAIYHFCAFFINAARSIPYIIFMVMLLPFTRMLVGTSIGTLAASVPLSLSAILWYSRMVEESLHALPKSLIELGPVIGASQKQIIFKILIPESMPALISSLASLMISLVGFSAMAGAVGGGGLGDLAIRYGYQRYDLVILFVIVCILIVLVQMIQWLGLRFSLRR